MSSDKYQDDGGDAKKPAGTIDRFLNFIEVAGNKLPDPAILFLLLMLLVWFLSWPLSRLQFDAVHPVTQESIAVVNQVNGDGIALLLTSMVDVCVHLWVLFLSLCWGSV